MEIKIKTLNTIHDIPPRETIGRETILRFSMQFQAAAYAALEILTGKDVDRVYCDYHDDFVVRRTVDGCAEYHFFQVKTKKKMNYQWGLRDVFSLKKKSQDSDAESLAKIRDSFAGKLFVHSIEFQDACREISILSNVHFHDDVVSAVAELGTNGITSKSITFLLEKFTEIFKPQSNLTLDDVKKIAGKLTLLPAVTYIGDDPEIFVSAARRQIYKHSEIDLTQQEVDDIANSLVMLVMNKSYSRLENITPTDLEGVTAICLEDLLSVLSISTEVYRNLLAGEDENAIKTASILQRQLKAAGATDSMIELCSRLKVKWDIWLRKARHIYTELDLTLLLDGVDSVCVSWLREGGEIARLREKIESLHAESKMQKFSGLDVELLFGGINASLVRRATK